MVLKVYIKYNGKIDKKYFVKNRTVRNSLSNLLLEIAFVMDSQQSFYKIKKVIHNSFASNIC